MTTLAGNDALKFAHPTLLQDTQHDSGSRRYAQTETAAASSVASTA